MAIGDELVSGPFASTTIFSTASDQVVDEDHEVGEFPHGRVAPAPRAVKSKQTKKRDVVDRPVDSQVVADPQGTRLAERGHPAFPKPEKKPSRWKSRLFFLLLIAAIIGAILYWGVPEVEWALSTTSTDDAFVSGHTTYVSPRVAGLLTEVLVESNDRVEPGDVLARLDREPFVIALRQSESSLTQAEANLALSKAQVKSQLEGARASFFQRKNQQEQLQRQVRSLEAQVASLRASQSSQHLAELDQARLKNLVTRGSASQSELDQRNNTLDMANQQVTESWTAIQETRAALGLKPDYENPSQVPDDLLQKQSAIETAVSNISSTLAQIGIDFDASNIKPGEAFENIIHMDNSKGLEDAFHHIVDQAPAVKVAQAALVMAQSNLDNARLQLSWTEIKSEVSGYIQDRSGNPGNRVEEGANILSIRSDYIWVDANFKETQISTIKIGHPVDLYVDAYPDKVFKGRVSGFNAGTGLSESLLPPENATGNYIKVTQRLPVRIELVEPNPRDTPLFIGLSVVPYVKIKEEPTGPDAGERLHPSPTYRQNPSAGGGPAGKRVPNRVEIENIEAGGRP